MIASPALAQAGPDAPAPAADERPRLTLAETLADSRVLATRQLRKILRRPVMIVFAFVQPIMFVLLFRYVLGGAIDTGSVDYVNFLVPGIMVQTAIFGALMTGIGLSEDLQTGVVDRFRSLPIARSAVLVGRTAADVIVNVLTLVVMLAVGVAVGFRPTEPAPALVSAFLLMLGFAYVFSWISAFIALAVRDPETAQSAGMIWVFPLTFASSAFVPADSMPGFMQAFAELNPVTLTVGRGPFADDRHGRRAGARARRAGVARRPARGVRAPVGPFVPPGLTNRALTPRPLPGNYRTSLRKGETDELPRHLV